MLYELLIYKEVIKTNKISKTPVSVFHFLFLLQIVGVPEQLIQPLPNQLRILVVFNQKLLRLVRDGPVVQLELAQRVQWPQQLLPVGIVPLQHAQRLDGRFQRAQATIARLGSDDVVAVAGADQLDLAHRVQRRRAVVDGLGLGPGAVDEDQVERAVVRSGDLFEWDGAGAGVEQERLFVGEDGLEVGVEFGETFAWKNGELWYYGGRVTLHTFV